MYSKVNSIVLQGLEGRVVEVEADIRDGLPGMEMVGALGTEVREARERVKTALTNTGYRLPPKKVTVNLSPSDIRKEGNGFDLPIAVSILMALGYLPEGIQNGILFAGELGLNGDVRPVSGILPMVIVGMENGFRHMVLPEENRREAEAVGGIRIVGVKDLVEVMDYLNEVEAGRGEEWIREMESSRAEKARESKRTYRDRMDWQADEARMSQHNDEARMNQQTDEARMSEQIDEERGHRLTVEERKKLASESNKSGCSYDFSDLIGQTALRRAAEVAVSGRHNFLMVGPPGSGKTMVARRLPGILPPMTREDTLEVSKIYSVCGMLNQDHPLVEERPFRSPHHTVTATTLIGGGRIPRPGEVSLADQGVLFLDELTEFHKATLDTLRQPMEEGKILISRNLGSYEYPAHFMLVAGMNPCPCGYFPDRSRCSCTEQSIRRYLSHVSRPLLDRIDVCMEASAIPFRELSGGGQGESSAVIRERVLRTQKIQEERYKGEAFSSNSQIPPGKIKQYCFLGEQEKSTMERIYQKLGLSARGYHKILKVARTIADMEEAEKISVTHLSEAISYRNITRKFWEEE